MLGLRDILGSFLKLRSLRCDLTDTDIDADQVVASIVKSELFCNLGTDTLSDLLGFMEVRRVRAGAYIIKQGERSDMFYVLAAGNAIVTHKNEEHDERVLAKLVEPTGFGDEALLGSKTHSVTVKMESDGIILRITQAAFSDFISDNIVNWMSHQEALDSDINNKVWLWVEEKNKRVKVSEGTLGIPLHQLRESLVELNQDSHYLCCSRDGKASSIAAFFLGQRGFSTTAISNGRAAVSGAKANA